MFEFFLAENKPSVTLSSLPDDILLRIFSEFSPVQWITDHSGRGRWPQIPTKFYNRRLEEDSIAHLRTKRALSLVSRQFNILTKRMLYEYIAVLTIKQLRSLHQAIRQQPTVAVNMACFTKRLDIIPTDEPIQRERRAGVGFPGPTRIEPLYSCAMRVWEACPKITHLTVSIMYEPLPNEKFLSNSIRDRFPELKVFSWRNGPMIDHFGLLSDFAPNLRVLDLSKAACLQYFEEKPDKVQQLHFPHLHTLRGPINVICRDFSEFGLPALRTFIAEHDDWDVFDQSYGDAFFLKHGPKIIQLTSRVRVAGIKLKYFTNLRSLTFRVGDDILSKPEECQCNTSLRYIGLLEDSDSDSDDSSTNDTVEVFRDKLESTNMKVLAAKRVNFPNIRTVQFLTKTCDLESWTLHTALDLKNSSIRFLNHAGKVISFSTNPVFTGSSSKPSNAKSAQPSRVGPRVRRRPKFAKGRPDPSLNEIETKAEAKNADVNTTDDTLSKTFDFSLSLDHLKGSKCFTAVCILPH